MSRNNSSLNFFLVKLFGWCVSLTLATKQSQRFSVFLVQNWMCVTVTFYINSKHLIFMLEGDLTDQASCPRSSGSDPQTVISDTVVLSVGTVRVKVAAHPSPHSPTSRHNPFNEDSDTNTTNTSADVTPVHVASRYNTTIIGDDMENASNELEVIRYRSYSFSFGLVGSHSTGFSCIIEHQIIATTWFSKSVSVVC